MKAPWVVEVLDQVEDRHLRLGLDAEAAVVDQLALERSEEALIIALS
jgi:hypothetical protein